MSVRNFFQPAFRTLIIGFSLALFFPTLLYAQANSRSSGSNANVQDSINTLIENIQQNYSDPSNSTGNDPGGFLPTQAISIEPRPRFPEPNTQVEFTLNDYAINSVGATITWYEDDELLNAYTNQRTMFTVAPPIGEQKSIKVRLQLPNGVMLEESRLIKPTRVDIIIDADTTVPIFYRGGTLPVQQSQIRATAIVHTGDEEVVTSNNLSFVWKARNNVINKGNTRGGNTVSFIPPLRYSVPITVEVTNLQGEMIGRKTVEVPLAETEVLFYTNNPLRGLDVKSLGPNYFMTEEELPVQAHLYYAPQSVALGNPSITWRLNNRTFPHDKEKPFEIVLGKQGTGTFRVGFEMLSRNTILSRTKGSLTISF